MSERKTFKIIFMYINESFWFCASTSRWKFTSYCDDDDKDEWRASWFFSTCKNYLTFPLFINELMRKGKLLIENYSLKIKSKLVRNLEVSILHLNRFPSYSIFSRIFYIMYIIHAFSFIPFYWLCKEISLLLTFVVFTLPLYNDWRGNIRAWNFNYIPLNNRRDGILFKLINFISLISIR